MKPNSYFSGFRFARLLQLDGVFSYQKISVIGLATVGILMLFVLSLGYTSTPRDFHMVWFPIVLLAGGFIFTSSSFSELDTTESRISYLNLPASTFEKFLSKLLVTNIGYVIITTLVYWIFAWIANGLVAYWFKFEIATFEPFSKVNWLIIRLYIVLQGLFLIGAIFYNRYAFFKTALTLLIIALVLELIGAIFFRFVFWEHFEGFYKALEPSYIEMSEGFQDFLEFKLWPGTQYLFWLGLAPFLWVVGYFKLKEREV